MVKYILYYLLAMNAVTFFIYGLDKWKAVHKRWRIPEATLLFLAVIGGSAGAWIGMQAFRHKTKHAKFKFGIPLIFAVQCIAVILYRYHF